MWFDCTKTTLKKLSVTYSYNNSLRCFMGLPWRNCVSEMFVTLHIRSFELLQLVDIKHNYVVFIQACRHGEIRFIHI